MFVHAYVIVIITLSYDFIVLSLGFMIKHLLTHFTIAYEQVEMSKIKLYARYKNINKNNKILKSKKNCKKIFQYFILLTLRFSFEYETVSRQFSRKMLYVVNILYVTLLLSGCFQLTIILKAFIYIIDKFLLISYREFYVYGTIQGGNNLKLYYFVTRRQTT